VTKNEAINALEALLEALNLDRPINHEARFLARADDDDD
jgi:hypothetical protein